MRLAFSFVALVALAASPVLRAEDPPAGFIGVQLKLDEGKLVVLMALPKSPADTGGIKPDDVLLKINDYKIKADAEQEDLVSAVKEVGKYKPGEKVKVTVKRGDKEVVLEITVGKRADFIKEKD